MTRMATMIGIEPDRTDGYKALHAAVWPGVPERLAASGIRNHTIFLREPENLLFGYRERHGKDFDADMRGIVADLETQRWCAALEPVVHTDQCSAIAPVRTGPPTARRLPDPR